MIACLSTRSFLNAGLPAGGSHRETPRRYRSRVRRPLRQSREPVRNLVRYSRPNPQVRKPRQGQSEDPQAEPAGEGQKNQRGGRNRRLGTVGARAEGEPEGRGLRAAARRVVRGAFLRELCGRGGCHVSAGDVFLAAPVSELMLPRVI